MMMSDLISRQAAIDEIKYELEMINSALDSMTLDFNARERRFRQRKGEAREILNSIQQLPSVQPKAYTKADYIMALHKEYGCTIAEAQEAHNKALEYLRSKAIVKG